MSHPPKTKRPCQDYGRPFLDTEPTRFCPNCRWRHRGQKPKKYVWTAEYLKAVHEAIEAVAEVDGYPKVVDREHLSEITGYKRSSRDTYLQRLVSRRLVVAEARGQVRAADELFR